MKTVRMIVSVLVLFGLAGSMAFGQAIADPQKQFVALVADMKLDKEKNEAVSKRGIAFLAQIKDYAGRLATLLAPAKDGAVADPQAAAKVSQIKQEFNLQLQAFHLDLIDSVGEDGARRLFVFFQPYVPAALADAATVASHIDPSATHSGAGPIYQQLLGQLKSLNEVIVQLLATLSLTPAGDAQKALLQSIGKLLEAQAGLIKSLNGQSASSSHPNPAMAGMGKQ